MINEGTKSTGRSLRATAAGEVYNTAANTVENQVQAQLGRPFPWTTTTGRWDAVRRSISTSQPFPGESLRLWLMNGVTAGMGSKRATPVVFGCRRRRTSWTVGEWMQPSNWLNNNSSVRTWWRHGIPIAFSHIDSQITFNFTAAGGGSADDGGELKICSQDSERLTVKDSIDWRSEFLCSVNFHSTLTKAILQWINCLYHTDCSWKISVSCDCVAFITARSSYASAVLGIVILSVCPSVGPAVTRVLCDKTKEHTDEILTSHERVINLIFWYQKRLVGDVPGLHLKFALKVTHPFWKTLTSTNICL